MIAHVAGLPLEELLAAVAASGASLGLVRAWLTMRLRRQPHPARD